MNFVQLDDLHVHVQIDVVENLAVPLLIETYIADRFVNGLFPMEQHIDPSVSPSRNHFRIHASVRSAGGISEQCESWV